MVHQIRDKKEIKGKSTNNKKTIALTYHWRYLSLIIAISFGNGRLLFFTNSRNTLKMSSSQVHSNRRNQFNKIYSKIRKNHSHIPSMSVLSSNWVKKKKKITGLQIFAQQKFKIIGNLLIPFSNCLVRPLNVLIEDMISDWSLRPSKRDSAASIIAYIPIDERFLSSSQYMRGFAGRNCDIAWMLIRVWK